MNELSNEGLANRPIFKMIKDVKINKFKDIKSINLKDCKKINIITGENGSGKTSLLESLFLVTGGSPELALRFRQWRGLDLSGTPMDSNETPWDNLFHDFSKENEIFIEVTDDRFGARSLTIRHEPATSFFPTPGQPDFMQQRPSPVSFEWSIDGKSTKLVPLISVGGIQSPFAVNFPVENFFFSSGNHFSSFETSKRFSTLSQRGEKEKIVGIMSKLFPSIKDIGIEIYQGATVLSAELENKKAKMPLPLISGGTNKLMTIISASYLHRNSISFIDEVENGFHYSTYDLLWKSLLDVSLDNDSQIFVSTHSYECLQSAAKLAQMNQDKFKLIKMKGGVAKEVNAESFIDAIEDDREVR